MFTISDELLSATKMTSSQLMQELALYLYEKNKLSFGQAHRLAGLDVLQFQELLWNNEIPLHYGIEDLEEDMKAVAGYGRL